jgi:hypothetical protein
VSDGISERLARWSQRKLAARQTQRGQAAPDDARALAADVKAKPVLPAEGDRPADATGVVQDGTEEKKSDQTSGDARPALPSIEELNAASDYTPFLAQGVPEALTRAALRKLWLSDPVLANLDGLNDYDEDFNVVDQMITSAQSNYKVGRGYLEQDEPEVAEADDEDNEAVTAKDVGDDSQKKIADIAADIDSDKSASAEAEVKLSRPASASDREEPSETTTDVSSDSAKVSKA